MKEASFQCILRIYFYNDFDVNQISESTGIKPYIAKRYSESGFTQLGEKKSGCWEYYKPAEYVDSMGLNEVLTDFLRPFSEEKVNIISDIAKRNKGTVWLAVNIYFHHKWLPEMIFEENVMKVLHKLNANIAINMNEEK